ncbi:MAG: hypothetical protein JSW47_15870, partial [Phycisphaerales bacterium]
MCGKLICLISFVLVLGLVSNVSAGLIAHWEFDEGSGTIARDSSAKGHDGSLLGDPQWVAGMIGSGALSFDGTDGLVEVSHDASLSLTDALTITAWVQVHDLNTYYFLVCKQPSGTARDNYPGNYEFRTEVNSGALQFGHQETEGEQYTFYTSDSSIAVEQWHHVAVTIAKGDLVEFYIDGVAAGSSEQSTNFGVLNDEPVRIGGRKDGYSFFNGLLDDIRLYDRALSATQIQKLFEGIPPTFTIAEKPDPADGAMLEATWVNLSWSPGDSAVSHDVYLGDNFDDVNDSTGDTFRGNQAATTFIVGFTGFPYPDGLVPGTTYYWRIDEVNETDPNSPWKGDVWSFSIPPKTAYNPYPPENARFIDPNVELSWAPGFGAKLHTVYFGESFDEVDAATGGTAQAVATFTPAGPLEPEKTYYWRVDEFDVAATHKGPVWSFTTGRLGGGVKGEYYHHDGATPHSPAQLAFGALILTRTDPEIAFQWGNGSPDASINADDYAVRWTGEVEAGFTETYTFYTNTDDGVILWVDGQELLRNWTDHASTENKGKIDLIAGRTYPVEMWWYERGGGAVAELRWSSPRTPKQIIPSAALSFLVHANKPNPSNGTEGLNLMSKLTWSPGDFAGTHDVYLGTDADAVANATKASPEYKGSKTLGDESMDPGLLAFDTTYYWRVDEVNNTNPESPWKGSVWSFWTGDFLVVDDFESYDDVDPAPGEPGLNRIFDKWIDGYGNPLINGAVVGNPMPPYAEQTIVHGGFQSTNYAYDNAGKTSEATLTLVYPRDWTVEGVTKLSLWVRGSGSNAPDRMFVALNGTAVVYHDDPAATQMTGWTEWVIDLVAFGVDLTNVNTITIGVGTKNAPSPTGGQGTMYF